MTKRKNMTAGERQLKLEKQVEQLSFATKIFQQLMQQTGNNVANIGRDVSELTNRQRELQYRFLAYQELTDIAVEDINSKAEELQIKDFEEFSAKDDLENNYSVVETVEEDSIIIFTTSAPDKKGYLRSKQELTEIAFPKMKEDLLGKKAGDKIDVDINGVVHNLTLLGVRKAPEQEEKAENEQEENGQEMPEKTGTSS